MRIMIAVGLLALATRSAAAPGFPEDRWLRFVQTIDKFDRKLKGCPEGGFPPALQCSPYEATFDAKLWADIQKQAKEIFKLAPAEGGAK